MTTQPPPLKFISEEYLGYRLSNLVPYNSISKKTGDVVEPYLTIV